MPASWAEYCGNSTSRPSAKTGTLRQDPPASGISYLFLQAPCSLNHINLSFLQAPWRAPRRQTQRPDYVHRERFFRLPSPSSGRDGPRCPALPLLLPPSPPASGLMLRLLDLDLDGDGDLDRERLRPPRLSLPNRSSASPLPAPASPPPLPTSSSSSSCLLLLLPLPLGPGPLLGPLREPAAELGAGRGAATPATYSLVTPSFTLSVTALELELELELELLAATPCGELPAVPELCY